LLLYLDLNCFNRPFDDQRQDRIARETAAVLAILHRIDVGMDQLAWSSVLTLENSRHPLPDRCHEIASWRKRAKINVLVDPRVSSFARRLNESGMTPLDATHLACAEIGGCDRYLTCDDRLLRSALKQQLRVLVQNPFTYMKEYGNV